MGKIARIGKTSLNVRNYVNGRNCQKLKKNAEGKKFENERNCQKYKDCPKIIELREWEKSRKISIGEIAIIRKIVRMVKDLQD